MAETDKIVTGEDTKLTQSMHPKIRIVAPSWEVLTPLDGERILKSIETVGRTCYQSARNTTDDSCYRFVKMLIDRGHEAMIEHEIITVRFNVDRAIQNELVRHRLSSFAVESTRFVNYSLEKNGHGREHVSTTCG